MLNLIKEQDDIDKIHLYAKGLSEPKYDFLIKKRENVGTKHYNDPNALLRVLILVVFNNMIAGIMTNKEF